MAYDECKKRGAKPGDTIMIKGEPYICPKPKKSKKASNQTGSKPSGAPNRRGYGGF
jgi:hypothetical protein